MSSARYYIDQLQMTAHPEGGYYKQVYSHPLEVGKAVLGADIEGHRPLATSIYFLLDTGDKSHLHQLKSDEIWYYHDGEPLTIVMIQGDVIREVKLGLDIENGEMPQVIVPAGTIFGSYNNSTGYSLVGCMVAFGFDFRDFKLIKASELLKGFPNNSQLITDLCIE